MRPIDLSEFIQKLWISSDTQIAEFAEEILEMIDMMPRLETLEMELEDRQTKTLRRAEWVCSLEKPLRYDL